MYIKKFMISSYCSFMSNLSMEIMDVFGKFFIRHKNLDLGVKETINRGPTGVDMDNLTKTFTNRQINSHWKKIR